MVSIDALLDSFTLEETGPNRFRGQNVAGGHGVVFGGQLMAQALLAGQRGHDDKSVETLHTVFARAGQPDLPMEVVVEPMHTGRTVASTTVTLSQGDRLCARSIVMLSADEPDTVRYGDGPPRASSPTDDDVLDGTRESWEIRVAGGVDINDPDAVGPPVLDVWTRFAGAPDDPTISQALLAFASDAFLIGTAMRPHAGVGQSQAHRTLTTGVLSHTLSFHEPVAAGDWLLLAHESRYAGRGRTHGRAEVFQDGRLVASYVQDSLLRGRAAEGGPL